MTFDIRDRAKDALARYAHAIRYETLPAHVAWKAKAHLIDTLGALLAGSKSIPARIARDVVASAPSHKGATIIGTTTRTTPDNAAFANAVAARGVDTLDAYHAHGKVGHPADVIAPLLTIAEYSRASGKELIAAVAVAYELFCWLRDNFEHKGFDNTTCARIAAAAGVGKLLRLGTEGIGECLALCAATDNALKAVRSRPAVMTRNSATGYQSRGAVFAGLLAEAGAMGPARPFEGPDGWFERVAAGNYDLDKLGGVGAPWRILDTWLKMRSIPGVAYPLVLAAEKLVPLVDPDSVERIAVDVYGKLKKGFGEGEKRWAPDSSDTADHSAPFIVATILTKGALTLDSFDDDHIRDSATSRLMQKVEVAEDELFTAAYKSRHDHHARITIFRKDGSQTSAETGGDVDDFNAPRSEEQLNAKFHWLADKGLGSVRAAAVVSKWWQLEVAADVSTLVGELTLDRA